MDWSKPVSNGEAYKRAGGRRAYNAMRHYQMNHRRFYLLPQLLTQPGKLTYTEIAKKLGVSRTTIYRDLEALKLWRDVGHCPVCGSKVRDQSLGLALKVIRDLNNRLEKFL